MDGQDIGQGFYDLTRAEGMKITFLKPGTVDELYPFTFQKTPKFFENMVDAGLIVIAPGAMKSGQQVQVAMEILEQFLVESYKPGLSYIEAKMLFTRKGLFIQGLSAGPVSRATTK